MFSGVAILSGVGKDYKHKRISSEKLTGTEFVQRFALHILPARMPRMRYAGLFQAEGLKNRLEVCRAALGEYQLNHPDSQQSNQPKAPPSPDQWREDEDEQVEASVFSNGMKCQ